MIMKVGKFYAKKFSLKTTLPEEIMAISEKLITRFGQVILRSTNVDTARKRFGQVVSGAHMRSPCTREYSFD